MNSSGDSEPDVDVEITGKLLARMEERYGRPVPLLVRIRLTEGPCRDDWCQPIRSLVADFVADDTRPASAVPVKSSNGITVYFDPGLLQSIRKRKGKVTIGLTPLGKIKIEGIHYPY